ncbi:hypothetical protein AVEN_214537-1 [Araneus ventricosus]|uniref:HTH CENPB-type domain-containing protein n=1 Tax=Araneus ventricosus TaxID=182803 RepID=A0A4Y2GI86_ARAVE|nr:hypothetical protein AVEN_214537-1 [Araneus ventricosus]
MQGLRKAEKENVKEVLFKWFTLQRSRNLPITGAILQAKANEFEEKSFVCSNGWLNSRVGLTKKEQTEDDNLPLSIWLEKHGVNAFSENEIEHFECCDEDVITSREVNEEDIVVLLNEKNNFIRDSSSDMEKEQDEPRPSMESIHGHVSNQIGRNCACHLSANPYHFCRWVCS